MIAIPSFLSRGRSVSVLCWVGCLLMLGCSNSNVPAPSAKTAPAALPGPSGAELLAKMRSVYCEASSYADNSSVVFYAVSRMTGGEQETPFTRCSVAFQRPNRLYITDKKYVGSPQEESYEIASDGVTVRSAAGELPDQIHEAISPLQFTTENFLPEPLLRGAVLQNSIENTFPQLALLFVQDQEQPIFPGEENLRVLADGELDGKSYHRIELPSPAGKRILWVDQDNYTLRRMELPIDDQRQTLNARNQFTQLSVWIDFENVAVNPEIEAETFALSHPEGTRRVRRFIPPPPAGPSEMFGQPVGQYVFKTLEGESVTPASLVGKVTVLDFWSTNCPPCKTQTPVLNQVYQHFEDTGDVEFLAVSTDSRVVSNEVVAKTMASWGGEMPVVRDYEFSGNRKLGVRVTPTLVLVDGEGQLQVFQPGAHQKPEPLIDAIQRLVDGEDIAATDRRKHAEYVEQYEQALEVATVEDSLIAVEITRPEIPPRQLPEKLQLKKLWQTSSEQFKRPGDMLVLGHETWGPFVRFLALDAGQAIVESNYYTGEVMKRHELPAHDEQSGGFLRCWINDKGEPSYLVSGVGWQKVFVLDQNWEQVLSFPDESHSGIGDVLFTDLDNSDTPVMYVGYWGGLGVQGGTLDGRRLWSNRRLDHVLQVGAGPEMAGGNRTTWCTSTRGTLMHLGTDGRSIEERYITGQTLVYFASQPDGENHCGLSVGKLGQYTAVGFDALNSADWEYALPPGEYVEPLPRVQSVHIPNADDEKTEPGWLIAAANGSLHWLDLQGELIDRFDYGEILTGVKMYSIGEKTFLYLATAEQLTAWEVIGPTIAETKDPAEPTTEDSADEKSVADEPESAESEESTEPDATEAGEE